MSEATPSFSYMEILCCALFMVKGFRYRDDFLRWPSLLFLKLLLFQKGFYSRNVSAVRSIYVEGSCIHKVG